LLQKRIDEEKASRSLEIKDVQGTLEKLSKQFQVNKKIYQSTSISVCIQEVKGFREEISKTLETIESRITTSYLSESNQNNGSSMSKVLSNTIDWQIELKRLGMFRYSELKA
jgi:lipopolysaccharide assembly outer membrane protein LptD (OstA)